MPEPFGPTSPTFSPGLSWNEASTKSSCLPYWPTATAGNAAFYALREEPQHVGDSLAGLAPSDPLPSARRRPARPARRRRGCGAAAETRRTRRSRVDLRQPGSGWSTRTGWARAADHGCRGLRGTGAVMRAGRDGWCARRRSLGRHRAVLTIRAPPTSLHHAGRRRVLAVDGERAGAYVTRRLVRTPTKAALGYFDKGRGPQPFAGTRCNA